jgi:16S rRNA (cytosine1402-N4)-methyltransferase
LKKIQTTAELAKVLAEVASPGYENGRIHPATRTFQALRIAVNDEITNLEVTLPRAARVLARGGRLIVISFQSLEDAIVKQFGHAAQPSIHVVTKKPIYPSGEELAENSRSRSAVMRVFEKL